MTPAARKPSPPRPLAASQVRYLAFEGGGAKGVAFIGAIAALEALGIRPASVQEGPVVGLAGASAGSMTIFLYALGATPERLMDVQLAPGAFTRFYDKPATNWIRTVGPRGYSLDRMRRFGARRRLAVPVADEAGRKRFDDLRNFPLGDIAMIGELANQASQVALRKFLGKVASSTPELAPMITTVTASTTAFRGYLYCLLYDLGLFSGTEVRQFLAGQLVHYRPQARENLGIGEFVRGTGVSMAFSAANASTGGAHYLRASTHGRTDDDTPTFPLIDAVAISSAYPLVFKPYVVHNRRDVPSGYWLDGGINNNLPIHAFDAARDLPLNPGMLGIRLETKSPPFVAELFSDVGQYFNDSYTAFLIAHVLRLFDTAAYASERGQVRTPQEDAQTVSIAIPDDVLSTLNFNPGAEQLRMAVLLGFDAVARYFHPDFTPVATATAPTEEMQRLRRRRQQIVAQLAWRLP